MRQVSVKLRFSLDGESAQIETADVPHSVIIECLNTIIKGLAEALVKEAEKEVPEDGLEKYLDGQIIVDRHKLHELLAADRNRGVADLSHIKGIRQRHTSLFVVFRDSYNNRVRIGDRIEIERHYNYEHLKGMKAVVVWDTDHGQYQWAWQDRNTGWWNYDGFAGVSKFKKID